MLHELAQVFRFVDIEPFRSDLERKAGAKDRFARASQSVGPTPDDSIKHAGVRSPGADTVEAAVDGWPKCDVAA